MAAFVLGNGTSRRSIDVELLLKIASVYGCNALYRTHTPTVLVSTDRPISQQIQESGYAKTNRFYTRRPIHNLGAQTVPREYFGFSSGPIATALAAKDHHTRIYLLGFDMGPSETGKFNNVYADTEFYKQTINAPTFTGNWARQLCTVAKDHPNCEFIRVHGTTTAEIPDFNKVPNMQKLQFADFVARINKPKDL
jgi:hypothetical protein